MVIKQKDVTTISAKDFMPTKLSIPSLRRAAKKCEGCHLYKNATQTVFGSDSEDTQLMVVGEIPGDKEDQIGKPFVGPAGTLLRKTFETSGLDLEDIYLTNVVKHFKFSYINKRRMHRSPVRAEINACKPWLEAEIKIIQPKVILCLGLIAAKTLVTKDFHLKEQRGKWFDFSGTIKIVATSILLQFCEQ